MSQVVNINAIGVFILTTPLPLPHLQSHKVFRGSPMILDGGSFAEMKLGEDVLPGESTLVKSR